MSEKQIPGASKLDQSAHRVHMSAISKHDDNWRVSSALCVLCGCELETVYCEERLYMVRCRKCEIVTLVKAGSPEVAANRIGIIAIPADEWCEDYGDCLWWQFPVHEPPYFGSPISYDRYGHPTVPEECTHFTEVYVPKEPSNENE